VHARWLPAGTVGAVGIVGIERYVAELLLTTYSLCYWIIQPECLKESIDHHREKKCVKYRSYEIDGCPVHITIKLIELNVWWILM
jgi:hypothetical protein